ncbi:MAG TPA: hypothetical protein DCQ06_02280 [Myxococcales bacterium]|nr:hypothetical protein [Myxococcales bacterium]HAN30402.1 hypothetical protein [Myxococcales bacterium]
MRRALSSRLRWTRVLGGLCVLTIGCGTGQPALDYADPSAGFFSTSTIDAQGSNQPDVSADQVKPSIEFESPSPDQAFEGQILEVVGRVQDDLGVQRVQVRLDAGPWLEAEIDSEPADLGWRWRVWLDLSPGDHKIEAQVTDLAGKTADASVSCHRVRVVQISAQLPEKSATPVTLTLDRAAVKALIPTSAAKDLVMYLLDVRPLLLATLKAFSEPVVWGVDTKQWGKAEWNMHKMLAMTPDTADLSGTQTEPLMTMASSLGQSVPLLLSDVSGVAPTARFLTVEQVADAMYRNIVQSHPAMEVDPVDKVKKVPITLYDVLQDLTTLDSKLGPSGSHPGILYKSTATQILLPNFSITLTGQGNLRQFEGVDLSAGMRWLFVKTPGEDVVTFDFVDPDAFELTGVASEPLVDLFVRTVENKGYINSAGVKIAGKDGPFYKGASLAWKLPTWTIEYLIIDAVYSAFRDRFSENNYKGGQSYDVGDIKDASSWTWDKGWLSMKTVAGIGEPPAPTYWWEIVLEVAQKRLHDGGIAEGKASLQLPILGVPVDITAEDIIAKSRTLFEAQKSKLAAASIGDHSTYDTGTDLFAVRSSAGKVALMFVSSSDLPGATDQHVSPGVFADKALQTKISTPAESGFGDTLHEKWILQEDSEEVGFARDRDGSVWQLRVSRTGYEIRVALWPESAL